MMTKRPGRSRSWNGRVWASPDQREVSVVDVVDRPGSLGEVRELAHATPTSISPYATLGDVKIVIATDDLDDVRAAPE
jgi:hypothetical protein